MADITNPLLMQAVLGFLEDINTVFPELSEWVKLQINNPQEIISFFNTCVCKNMTSVEAIAAADAVGTRDSMWLPNLKLSTLTTFPGISDATKLAIYQHLANIYSHCPLEHYPFPAIPTAQIGNVIPVGKYAPIIDRLRIIHTDLQLQDLSYISTVIRWILYSGCMNAYLSTHTDTIVELAILVESIGIDPIELLEMLLLNEADGKDKGTAYMTKLMKTVPSKLSNSATRAKLTAQFQEWVKKHSDIEFSPIIHSYQHKLTTQDSGPAPTPEILIADLRKLHASEYGQKFFTDSKIDPKVGLEFIDKLEQDYITNGNFEHIFSETLAWGKNYAEQMMKTMGVNGPAGASASANASASGTEEEAEEGDYEMPPVYRDDRTQAACDKLREKIAAKKRRKKQQQQQQQMAAPSEEAMNAYMEKSIDDWVKEIEGTVSTITTKKSKK